MKTNTAVMAMIVAFVAMIGMTGFAAAVTTYDSSVTLDNKDSTWALTPCDDVGAVIEYNFAADTFEWSATGKAPLAGIEYSLIYYADKPDRFVNWGGDNPGALIGTMTTDANGDFTASGSTDIGMDLPHANDANIDEYDYCDLDGYAVCHGAKIWMVPSTGYNEPGLVGWNPANYLFETDLITYTRDAGVSIGYAFGCEGDTRSITLPIVISNTENVGSIDLILTYDPTLITVIKVTNGDMDDLKYNNVGAGQLHILANQNSETVINGEFDLANVKFAPDATATGTSDFGITVTAFTDATFAATTIPCVTRAGNYHIHPYMNGDVNDNGVVDSGDVMVLAKHLVGLCGFDAINECAADVNGNGNVDGSDLMYLAKHLLGFPNYATLK